MFKVNFFTIVIIIVICWGTNTYAENNKQIIWASKIIANSSKSNEFSALQILGEPNITSNYSIVNNASECAWTPNFAKNSAQWLTVGFKKNVSANTIYIHENIFPGAITSIYLYSKQTKPIRVYSTNLPQPTTKKGRILKVQLEKIVNNIQAIKIEVNNMHYYGKTYQIDAIGVSTEDFVYEVPIYELKDTLSSVAQRLSDEVNSPYPEVAPIISPSGNMLYFTRSGDPNNMGKQNKQDVYFSTKDVNGKFTKAKNIGKPLNIDRNNYIIAILPDENQALVGGNYFDNTASNSDFAITTFDGEKWGYPKKIQIEDYFNYLGEGSYCIAPSGKNMMFSIASSNNRGSHDLYVSFLKEDDSWTKPINLGDDINTAGGEITPFIASDGKTLYFSTNGKPGYGNYDVFMSERLDSTWTKWSKPQNLGERINSTAWDAYYTIDAKGEYAYFVADMNNSRNTDIYRIELQKEARPKPVALISGKVIDKKTGKPIEAKILYELLPSGKNIGTAISNKATGKYKILLPSGENYGLLAKADGYFAINQNIDLRGLDNYEEINRDITLVKIEEKQTIRLNNIFFDFNKSELLEESFSELNRVVDLLVDNQKMIISVNGHTDNIGNFKENKKLSLKRANSVAIFMIEKEIKSNRIHIKGVGSTQPVASNKTEEGRKRNRRVEFEIISK